jgi:hypothetical protein
MENLHEILAFGQCGKRKMTTSSTAINGQRYISPGETDPIMSSQMLENL